MKPCSNNECKNCGNRLQSVFRDTTPENTSKIHHIKKSFSLRRKEILFEEGQKIEGIYCVSSGIIKLLKKNANGEPQLVRLVGAGDILGYEALVNQTQHGLTARCVEEANICCLNKDSFVQIYSKSSEMQGPMLQKLWQDLDSADGAVSTLASGTVREKAATTLLRLMKKFGTQTPTGAKIQVGLTRQDFATLSGTVLESAVRLLSEFKKDGLIAVDGRIITVLKTTEIEKIARSE